MTHRYYTIRIDLEREAKRIPHGTEYKDKFWMIDVINGAQIAKSGGTSFGVEATGDYQKDMRNIFNHIEEIIHLHKRSKKTRI